MRVYQEPFLNMLALELSFFLTVLLCNAAFLSLYVLLEMFFGWV